MKVKEVVKKIEEKYPLYIKEKWDNIGLIIGDGEKEVTKVLVVLDVTKRAIDEAIEKGCNMIVSHHPFIFDSLKTITTKNSIGQKTIKLIQNDIAVYSMHTNLDMADDGLNDYLALKLELEDIEKIDPDRFEEKYIRTGYLQNEMTLEDATRFVKDKLKLDNAILISNDPNKVVSKVAICSGAGKSFINDAMKLKADVYITGDFNYHGAIDALEDDFSVIDAGHFGTERIVTELLKDYLDKVTECEILESTTMVNPLRVY